MNKIKLLLMLLLVSVFTAQAQVTPETLTVNDGTITNSYIPIWSSGAGQSNYSQVTSQFVIPDYDITDMVGMAIEKMTFYLAAPAADTSRAIYRVYLKIVDSERLTAIASETDATVVYTGELDNTQSEMVVDFDTPFDYEGGHLLIGMTTAQMGSIPVASSFYGVDKRDAARYGFTYTSGYPYSYVRNFLPKTTFSYYEETEFYTVAADAVPEEGGTVEGAGEYAVGRPCTLSATAATGYTFDKWTKVVDEDEEDVTTDLSFDITVTEDVTYKAHFTINTFNIEAYANPEDVGTVEGAGEYNYGETCTLTATVNPDSEYHFVNWTKNGIIESTEEEIQFEVYNNAVYYANFGINEYKITAAVNDTVAGSVTGAGTYAYGQTCILTAVANFGYEFVNWTLDGEEVSTETSISFEVENDAEYVANFNTLLVESDELTINDDDYWNSYSPMYVYWFDEYSKSQHIVLADKLADMGPAEITSLTYYFDKNYGRPNYSYPWTTNVNVDVYLTETDNEDFNGYNGYFDKTSATTVYTGTLTFEANGEVTINFTTPYTYNGGNLVVCVENLSRGTWMQVRFYGVDSGIYAYGTSINGLDAVPTNYGYNFSPKTTFAYNVVVPEESDVAMTPEIDFGRRANDVWSEKDYTREVTVTNTGKSATITDIAVNNPYFELDLGDMELPYTLKYNRSVSFSVTATGSADGEVEASVILTYNDGETVETTLSAIAYNPVEGDVWETAIVAEFDEDGVYENSLPVEGLSADYRLDGSWTENIDVVYKVTFDHEVMLTAGTNGNDGITTIYKEDFNEVGGPSWNNGYYYDGPVFANNRGNRDNNNFINETFDGEDIPEGWSVAGDGMNTWTVNTDNQYVSCTHNINAGQTLQGQTWLISPEMDLSNENNVLFKFKYMNKQWDNDIDGLTVSYRHNGGTWQELMATTEAHETWTEVEISLDPDTFAEAFQIGFAMDDHFGHGVLIDDITLTGYRLPEYQIENNYIPAGTYYIVFSSADEDFMQVNMQIDEVPAPYQSYIVYPNGHTNVAIDATMTYYLGWFTEEMQILFGVTNPPTETLLDWTSQLVPEIQLADLEYNKKYYVQINERNVSGTTEGVVVNFTTIQAPVANFTVDHNQTYLGTQDTLTFTWDAAENALGYNLYYGNYYEDLWFGTLNDEVLTGTEFTLPVDDVLWCDIDNPYMFAVKAVYKYGVSGYSDRQIVSVLGLGYINGYVYEQDGYTPIEGVTITMTGVDEFDVERSYEFVTDENGYYTYDTDTYGVYAGTYTVEAIIDGYQTGSQVVDITYYTWSDVNFNLTENYIAPQNVVAVEVDTTAVITWDFAGYNPPEPPTPTEDVVYTLVTDVTDLAEGDQVLIVAFNGEDAYVMSKQSNATTRAAVTITVDDNVIVNPETAEDAADDLAFVFTVGYVTENEAWTLYDPLYGENGGYLSATDGNTNALATNEELEQKGMWKLDNMEDDGGVRPTAVDGGRRMMQYNAQNTMFRCYGNTNQKAVYFFKLEQNVGNRSLQSFNIYRTDAYNFGPYDAGNTEIIAQGVTGLSYIDETWVELQQGEGSYKYGVSAVYEGNAAQPTQNRGNRELTTLPGVNESEIVWSEPLDINMEIENGVDITVTLNNGESPEGVQVVLTNTGSDEVIEVVLDETGYYAWETFRKGNYHVSVILNDDYSTVDGTLNILGETHLAYTLNYTVPITLTAELIPADYGEGGVCFINGGQWYFSEQHSYLYGDAAALYYNANSGKELVFWESGDTLVTRETWYEFTVTTAGEYIAHTRTIGNYYVVDNPQQYADNMSFIGIIQIEGETQNDLEFEVGAFAGDECRGSGRLNYYEQVNGYLMFLTVYGEEEGEQITFRLYSHANGEEYALRCATKEVFAADAVFGTPVEPYVFNFRNTVPQNVEFVEGWNWMSTYIEQSTFNGLEALKEGLGANGVSIVSQSNGFLTYDEEAEEWSGNLTALNNEEMFKVNTSADVEFEMEGYFANPAEHEITLYSGWTYLGLISTEPMSVEEAFAGLEPTDGDMVKAQEGFATYDAEAEEWSGSLNTLDAGLGFMYKSNNEEDVTFTYPSSLRGETVANVTSEHWTANVHAYPNNMTVTAVVELNDEELAGGDYELAAFADGEVRGSVKLVNAGANGRYYAFLTVAGKDMAELTFGLYDALTDEEMFDGETRLTYSNDAMVGSTNEPLVVSFRGVTDIDEHNSIVAMYPNPAEKGGYVRMIVTNETNYAQVEIVNSLGQVVSVQSTTQMPANIRVPEEAGVYTVRVITEGKNIRCQKLIVK